MIRIVAIGECMVEIAPVVTAGQFRLGYAGDTLNTAWYLRRLLNSEVQIDYFTAVGTDAVSCQMIGFLKQAGIGTENILRHEDKGVGLYMIHLQGGQRSFSYWRSDSAARTLAATPEPLQMALEGAHLAYFSGITLAILPASDRVCLLKVLRDFRSDGGLIFFDPNLRSKLWNSPDEMTDAVMQAAAISDVVLPSYEDESRWFGDEDLQATVNRYAVKKVNCCVVKNGPSRIIAYDGGQHITYDPIKNVTSIDTTAAGDSFNAGFIAARLNGADLHEAVHAGASLSAKVIGSRGALIEVNSSPFSVRE